LPRENFEAVSEKITKAERAGGMAQVVKHLPSKSKVLSSNTFLARVRS
jgi:hypothetical protein